MTWVLLQFFLFPVNFFTLSIHVISYVLFKLQRIKKSIKNNFILFVYTLVWLATFTENFLSIWCSLSFTKWIITHTNTQFIDLTKVHYYFMHVFMVAFFIILSKTWNHKMKKLFVEKEIRDKEWMGVYICRA